MVAIFPDDSSALLSLAEAHALMAARGPRHGLRFGEVVWPVLVPRPERRQVIQPVEQERRRRAVYSVREIPADQRRAITADALQIGLEQAGRKHGLSKESVQKVMRLEGAQMPANGKAASYAARGQS